MRLTGKKIHLKLPNDREQVEGPAMCTSIVVNKKKTIVGWNLDLLDIEYRVRPANEGVYIEVNDATGGWMRMFGANSSGAFVGLPTCWPTDRRSDPAGDGENVIMLDKASDDFDVEDCFETLKAVAQKVCPTVVSMVYDVTDRTVYWCENREWDKKARKRKCFGESLIE